MKVAVLVKRVPDTASVFKVAEDNKSIVTDNLKYVMSPYDEIAMEQAIRLKESDGAPAHLCPDCLKKLSHHLAFDRALRYRTLEKHYRKLMFGTDRFVRQEEPLMIEVIRNLELPAHMEEAIFRGNAEKLLNL